ncbi:ECF transporter S component [Oceanobacillus chungangensis]|uniref:ECF transporter S component n=1 Tax=Oceanobacillus chungangensis TaxID=1229152 RepID=A0A3D8Q0P4_9BACI|nr:ECF transporter S component [Oceanobacillus chungangensis]RDW22020.1 ECF transporter S component [Oceanobacillus chungangensis]
MNTYKLTLLALLAALAIVGRVVFQFIPNAQPVTSLVIICGILLGPLSAFILAILTTFLSNMLLGMGIWTIWQIISWGLIGLISGILSKVLKKVPMIVIVLFAFLSGYLYGFIISLTTYQVSGHFWPYYIAGLPFDTSHAIGNVVFIIIFYPIISLLMKKYASKRFSIRNTN